MLLKSDPISDGILKRFNSSLEVLMKTIEAWNEHRELPDPENYLKSVLRLCELARSAVIQRGSSDLFCDEYIATFNRQLIEAAEKIMGTSEHSCFSCAQKKLIIEYAENIKNRIL